MSLVIEGYVNIDGNIHCCVLPTILSSHMSHVKLKTNRPTLNSSDFLRQRKKPLNFPWINQPRLLYRSELPYEHQFIVNSTFSPHVSAYKEWVSEYVWFNIPLDT